MGRQGVALFVAAICALSAVAMAANPSTDKLVAALKKVCRVPAPLIVVVDCCGSTMGPQAAPLSIRDQHSSRSGGNDANTGRDGLPRQLHLQIPTYLIDHGHDHPYLPPI